MKIIFKDARTILEDQIEIPLSYILFSERYSDQTIRYGVAIINEETMEKSVIQDLTSDIHVAFSFFTSLVKGAVTPIHLNEIAVDYVSAI